MAAVLIGLAVIAIETIVTIAVCRLPGVKEID